MDNIQEELDEVLTEEELEADLKSLDFSNLKSAPNSNSVTTNYTTNTNTNTSTNDILDLPLYMQRPPFG